MELIDTDADCIITRESGGFEVDEWDNPINVKEIFKGRCRYQEGMQAFLGTSIRNCVVYIYKNVKTMENDVFEITTDMIHKRGIARTVRHIEMPLTGIRHTRIELNQVQDIVGDSNEGESNGG